MRVILVGAVVALLAGSALAQGSHAVRGYTRSDGTYVQPHMQTNPNATKNDNWSTRGNVNPYTGQEGTKPGDEGAVAPSQIAPPQFERVIGCRDGTRAPESSPSPCYGHGGPR